MPLAEIFRLDRKQWTQDQLEEVELFFMLAPFFRTHYEHEDLETLIKIVFYAKVEGSLHLTLNKKSSVIVLLQGHIEWFRQAHHRQHKKQLKNLHLSENVFESQQKYQKIIRMGETSNLNEVTQLRTDVVVKSVGERISQILFVPTLLYEDYLKKVRQRKIQRTMQILIRVFGEVSKTEMKELAFVHCRFREYRMNSYIYHAGQKPQYAYIIASGNVKIDAHGFNPKQLLQMVILDQNAIFGHNDLHLQARQQDAICCSAHCRVLQMDSEFFTALKLKPQPNQIPQMATKEEVCASKQCSLPRIRRFRSLLRPDQEQKIERRIVENCHILVNLSPRRKPSASFRAPASVHRDYSINQFQEKLKLFGRQQKMETSLDLQNKLF